MITTPNETPSRYNQHKLVAKYQTAPASDEPIEIVLFNGKNVNSEENIELLASAGTMLGENILSSARGIEEENGNVSPPKIRHHNEHSTETFAEAFLGSSKRLPPDGNISTEQISTVKPLEGDVMTPRME